MASSLRDALLAGAWPAVAELVAREPGRARERDASGNLPLHVALVCGAPAETVRLLLDAHRGGAAERNVGDEAEAFEAAQQSHARYGSGALRAAVFGFSGKHAAIISC